MSFLGNLELAVTCVDPLLHRRRPKPEAAVGVLEAYGAAAVATVPRKMTFEVMVWVDAGLKVLLFELSGEVKMTSCIHSKKDLTF